jgi:hypothetical protein
MSGAELLVDALGRVREVVHESARGLTLEELAQRQDEGSNSIAWLLWHLTRIQDDHVSKAMGAEQVWTTAGWNERFGLPFKPDATGWAHEPQDVAAVRVEGELLTGYHDAVHDHCVQLIEGLADEEFARIVDRGWTPPVTLGARLITVVSEGFQHGGQAAYLAGVLERRKG